MAVSMSTAETYSLSTGTNAKAASGKAGACCARSGSPTSSNADFDSHLSKASKGACDQTGPSAGAGPGTSDPGAPMDEAAFQKQMFEGFAKGVKPEVLERLSAWLPDVLNGGKKALKEAAKEMNKEEATDLKDLAKALDLDTDFTRVKDRDGLGKIIEKRERKTNEQGLTALKQAYGEHALEASTPHLAPSTSYETGSTLDATKQAVYDRFVNGLSEADQERLADWLPDVLFGEKSEKKAAKKLSNKEEDALEALAKEQGVKIPSVFRGDLANKVRLERLETTFKRDLALETTAELPSVVDMMLVAKFGDDNGDTAVDIDLKDDKILKEAKALEKEFSELDRWLPAVLAGRGEMPKDDPEAMKLLVKFADEAGFDPKKGDDLGERAEKALKYLEKQNLIHKSLHPGKDDEDTSFLLFTERFMQSTLAYGAKHAVVDQAKIADAAHVAEMLLGPDDGSNAPRELQVAGFQAAVLHRTDERLARPQEVMAASGYINKAETLAEQKSRLVESLLAFHVRENIGTPPMTPLQWAENYADLHPEMLDDLGNRAFNAPTGEKLQIVTQHLGVPGDHKFMIDKKRKVKIENDDLGNVQHFDVDKKKKSFFKKLLDVAVPVIGTVLTFVPGAQAIGMGINTAYSAYKGAEAIKHGDLLGGALSIAGAFAGGAANALSGAAARTAANVANGINVASQGLHTARAVQQGDMLGALAGGLSSAAMMGGGRNFQVAAGGVKTTQSLAEGDFLGAGAGFTGVVGDLAQPSQDPGIRTEQASHTGTSFAFSTISDGLNVVDGIQEGNFGQIGRGVAGGIKGIGKHIDDRQRLAASASADEGAEGATNAGNGAGANGNSDMAIRQASFTRPTGNPANQAVEVAGGDTLSQIAARHGTTVDDLMAANPGITDPDRIHAGQALNLPEGVRSVELDRQARLAEFGEVRGGAPILPSPVRPGLGDPTLQPGATHPNAGGNVSGSRPLDGNEMMAGAGEEVIDNFQEDVEGWRALSKEAGEALDDLLGAAQHMTAATPTDETQADYDDTRARGQALVEKGEAAVDAIKETLTGSEEPIAKPAADAVERLTNVIKEFNENLRAGNSHEVGAGIGDGVSAIIGAVSDVTRGALSIFVPRGSVDRPGGGGEGVHSDTTPATQASPPSTSPSEQTNQIGSFGDQGLKSRGSFSGRPFDPDNAGGPILNLNYRNAHIDSEGIGEVELHTSRFGDNRANQIMIERLRKISEGEMPPTDYDLRFYTHERRELERYRKLGIKDGIEPEDPDVAYEIWNNAHTATLEDFRISDANKDAGVRYNLYHPDTWENLP